MSRNKGLITLPLSSLKISYSSNQQQLRWRPFSLQVWALQFALMEEELWDTCLINLSPPLLSPSFPLVPIDLFPSNKVLFFLFLSFYSSTVFVKKMQEGLFYIYWCKFGFQTGFAVKAASVLNKVHKIGKKADNFAQGVREHGEWWIHIYECLEFTISREQNLWWLLA